MSTDIAERSTFSTEAGAVCLDFVNSVSSHLSEHPEEHLNSYSDLLEWGKQTGVLADGEALALAERANKRPTESVEVLGQALTLRQAIYAIFSAVAAGKEVPPESLLVLNDALQRALTYLTVRQEGESLIWAWGGKGDELDRMLWPVARSAANLLVEGELARVRECAGDTCGWLFLDASKNRSRRWCDMSDCGNRAKARRHYHRLRQATGNKNR